MKKILSFLLLLLIINNLFGNAKKYKYKIEEFYNQEKRVNNRNKYYPIYYIFNNIFVALGLYDCFEYEERIKITDEIISIIKNNNFALLTINQYYKNEDLIITFKPNQPPKHPNDTVFFFITNYSFKDKKIVYGDDMKDAYATYYIFDKEKELEFINNNNANNLANYYIYDEIEENDEKGKNLLLNEIKSTQDINNKFICLITLSEYYLMKNDLINANQYLEEAKIMLNKIDERKKENYSLGYNVIYDIYKYLNSDMK